MFENKNGSMGINVNDGYFEIKFESEGVFLIVYPPVGKGRKIESREVIEKLGKKQIKNFSKDTVEFTVLKADKHPTKIAEPQAEAKIDATASIIISPDKMKAFLTMNAPEGGKTLSLEDIVELLNRNGVVYGIDRETLESMAAYPVYNKMICIAEGIPAVNGQSGKVDFHFDSNKERKPTILDDGRVDYRELNMIENVHKGQILCSLVPPLPGTRGKTVTGIDLPALDGKPAKLPRGKNVEVSEDGQYILAGIDGQVNYIDGRVSVFSNYEVQADVDNSTGNITFVGNVMVRGNVLSGFTIDAGGNVEVWGVVEGAVIRAGGDIILRRGMQGLGKGVLRCGGDIIARYIEHSNIEAGNDIKAEAIMHSNVKCGNKLELSGRKGLLVGGTCKVGREIVAKVIGSHMATTTEVEVGVDPTLRERYKAMKEETVNFENDLRKADQAITLLRKLEAAAGLAPDKQEMLTKSIRTKLFFTSKIQELKEEMAYIEEKLQQDAYGKIRAANFIYPGTKVAIGTCMMFVKENLQYCTLYRDGADVRVGPINMA